MRKTKLPSQTALLLNGAAILVAGASLAVVLRSVFVTEDTPPCKERYASATRFSLERGGIPATPAELQGQLANSDWGLVTAARVVPVKAGPAKYALEIDLAKAPSAGRATSEERAGVGFSWVPQTFKRREAACLTYSVLPGEGFNFGRSGRLPGLQGASAANGSEPRTGFSVRFAWNADGDLEAYPHLPQWPEGRSLDGKHGKFALKPGHWTELEQEVVLNAPGKSDGILRIWQDGRLMVEKTDVVFRTTPSVALSGVLAETVGGARQEQAQRASQKITITPFELRWP